MSASPLARALLHGALRRLDGGRLVLIDGDDRAEFGEGDLRALVHVRSPRAYRMFLHGSRGLALGYAQGMWDSPDPTALIRLAARNAWRLDAARKRMALVREPYQWALTALGAGSPRRARRDIAAHYDLGNELFRRMLDPTMSYSCALFERPDSTLLDASLAKLELVCAKLDLSPADHVLEIGTGWGGFALHAALTRGCRVTTTTLSREQRDWTLARVHEVGVADRVNVLMQDYRELRGRYDKLASIEMIEAVGHRHFGTFFERCADLLRSDGLMFLQAITIDDRAYRVERSSRSFIRTLIFPNGCLPSMAVIDRALAAHSDLHPVDIADFTPHYVETLRRWRDNFDHARAALVRLGYDEPFCRLWRLYLSYCEAGFAERRITLKQFVLAKPHWQGKLSVAPDGSSAWLGRAPRAGWDELGPASAAGQT